MDKSRKLHNKKTGKLGYLLATKGLDRYDIVDDDYRLIARYNSLVEVIEDWGDYNPVEPLIEDEKIRKALRAVYDAAPHRDNVVYFDGRWTFRGDKFEVMFDDREIKIKGWTEGKAYHIEEFCGE